MKESNTPCLMPPAASLHLWDGFGMDKAASIVSWRDDALGYPGGPEHSVATATSPQEAMVSPPSDANAGTST